MAVMGKGSCLRIKKIYSCPIGPNPQDPRLIIYYNPGHIIIGEAVGILRLMLITVKLRTAFRVPGQAVQSIGGAHPQRGGRVCRSST